MIHSLSVTPPCAATSSGAASNAQRATDSSSLYPLLFKPNAFQLVWGSEDWIVSGMPQAVSRIANGQWANTPLTELVAAYPREMLGKAVAERYDKRLPLLTKIIDARDDLSIQVHPDDAMAQREHGKFGKSEMWYVLEAKPDAYLYAGFKHALTPEAYKARVEDGTICEVLAKHRVKKGDVFYLPAGRVHAICGGIKLVEVQQASDVTYRIFDYNRPGLDGCPRELHTALAAQAIDFTVYPDYRTVHTAKVDAANAILNTPYFSIKVIETKGNFHRNMLKYDSFVMLVNIGQRACGLRIRVTGDAVCVPPEAACFIPAALADYDLLGEVKVFEAFINNKKSIGQIISDFFYLG